ncbi:MAG: RDD family protein [Chitinophagaceae bacterium]
MQSETNDLLNFESTLVRATGGQRLANYLIDIASFYALFIILGIIIALVSPSTIENLDTDTGGFQLIDRLISLLLYAVYLGFAEAVLKGKTLGKLITGTRAVNLDGSKITASTAFSRGFSRAVPFCVFSALGSPCNPWQDKWTDTMVIDEKKSRV